MENNNTVWTTVLRATTNVRDEHGISPQVHANWTLESAADESGLNITQIYFGDDLKDLEGNKVVWDYQHHYEIEHKEDGLCMSLWWPVLHRPLDKAALIDKINASIAKYEVIDDPDDDYEIAFSAGHVDACETILDWVNS